MNSTELYKFDQDTDRILITCALPYVNNVPHLGNLVPILSADVYSRYLKQKEITSVYICATDEHGTRTEMEAKKAGISEDEYCRGLHKKMLSIFEWFNVNFTHFGRTSCKENHKITQDIFLKSYENKYIGEEETQQLYCSTCEHYLPDTFVEGVCPMCNTPGAQGDQCDTCGRFLDPLELVDPHCKTCETSPEIKTTRHLFLKLDAISPRLKEWLEDQKHWEGIIKNMPLGWIAEGLNPRAITRDLKWGVQVPKARYEDKVFYVWFDAPIGYIAATAEWAKSTGESLDDWWKGGKARLIHFLGKDNVPFHTLMWPASLMAADDNWNLPYFIASNEYLNYEGGAFSKSRNRGVFSNDVVEMGFPADAWRFYIMANRPEKRDSDFSFEAFQALVNAGLVGNLGNLLNRMFSFTKKKFGIIPKRHQLSDLDKKTLEQIEEKAKQIDNAYATFELRQASKLLLELGDVGNRFLQISEPWKTFKSDPEQCETTLNVGFALVHKLLNLMWPMMPERAETALSWMGCQIGDPFVSEIPLQKHTYLFEPVEDKIIKTLSERFLGLAKDPEPDPLVFEKQKGVTWPCVILEFNDLKIKRKIKALERENRKQINSLDLGQIESSEHMKEYLNVLEEKDLGRNISVQNLINIVRREGKLPNINVLVDIYNTFSLREGLVMGAYDRRSIRGKLIYAIADGSEHFIPVKGKDPEEITPGEWILKDETGMVVTKVTSKQSEAVAVTQSTTHCAICIQGNQKTPISLLEKISVQMAKAIIASCEGSFRVVHVG